MAFRGVSKRGALRWWHPSNYPPQRVATLSLRAVRTPNYRDQSVTAAQTPGSEPEPARSQLPTGVSEAWLGLRVATTNIGPMSLSLMTLSSLIVVRRSKPRSYMASSGSQIWVDFEAKVVAATPLIGRWPRCSAQPCREPPPHLSPSASGCICSRCSAWLRRCRRRRHRNGSVHSARGAGVCRRQAASSGRSRITGMVRRALMAATSP